MPLDQPPNNTVIAAPEYKGPTALSIFGAGDKLIVSISADDGKVTFGPGVKPDEAARQFWAAIRQVFPSMCKSK